jgi:branched-chain amino acid transport system substrate-binding protein
MRITRFGASLLLALGIQAASAWVAGAETLKIGVIAPLTGGGAPWGIAAAEATKILAAKTNAEGGLDVGGVRYKIEVIAYDDQYKAADSVAAYNRLLNQDGVKFMFIQTSPAAVALKQNVEDDKVLAITLAASPNALDAKSKYMFRANSTPDDYLPNLVTWLKNNIKERRIALVNPNDEVGFDFSKLQQKLMKDNGFEVLTNEMYERSTKDFQPMFTKIMGLKPEVIDLGGVPPATTGLMLRQLRELGYKGQIVKTAGPSPKEIVAAAGKEAAEGMIVSLFADPKNEGYQRIVAEYKKAIGQEPNEMVLPSYDGVSVLLRAIQKAGTVTDTAKVAAAFAVALPMPGVLGDELTLGGKTVFGSDQQVMSTIYVGAMRDGVPVVLGKTK